MTQKQRIIALLKAHPEGVTCQELADNFLYHHASQRIGEMNRQGFEIEFIKGDSVMSSRYRLTGEAQSSGCRKAVSPRLPSPQVSFTNNQGEMLGIVGELRYD